MHPKQRVSPQGPLTSLQNISVQVAEWRWNVISPDRSLHPNSYIGNQVERLGHCSTLSPKPRLPVQRKHVNTPPPWTPQKGCSASPLRELEAKRGDAGSELARLPTDPLRNLSRRKGGGFGLYDVGMHDFYGLEVRVTEIVVFGLGLSEEHALFVLG